jgi:hypothetical protein
VTVYSGSRRRFRAVRIVGEIDGRSAQSTRHGDAFDVAGGVLADVASGSRLFTIGTPFANRQNTQVEPLLGFCHTRSRVRPP